jgi:hypothetical protein
MRKVAEDQKWVKVLSFDIGLRIFAMMYLERPELP